MYLAGDIPGCTREPFPDGINSHGIILEAIFVLFLLSFHFLTEIFPANFRVYFESVVTVILSYIILISTAHRKTIFSRKCK